MSTSTDSCAVEIDHAVMRNLGRTRQWYASYPMPNRFVEAFGPASYESALARRRIGGIRRPLTLRIRLPLPGREQSSCDVDNRLLPYPADACHYLRSLTQEIALQASLLNDDNHVRDMRLYGATSTFLTLAQVKDLMVQLTRYFDFDPSGDCSIEVDQSCANAEYLAA